MTSMIDDALLRVMSAQAGGQQAFSHAADTDDGWLLGGDLRLRAGCSTSRAERTAGSARDAARRQPSPRRSCSGSWPTRATRRRVSWSMVFDEGLGGAFMVMERVDGVQLLDGLGIGRLLLRLPTTLRRLAHQMSTAALRLACARSPAGRRCAGRRRNRCRRARCRGAARRDSRGSTDHVGRIRRRARLARQPSSGDDPGRRVSRRHPSVQHAGDRGRLVQRARLDQRQPLPARVRRRVHRGDAAVRAVGGAANRATPARWRSPVRWRAASSTPTERWRRSTSMSSSGSRRLQYAPLPGRGGDRTASMIRSSAPSIHSGSRRRR